VVFQVVARSGAGGVVLVIRWGHISSQRPLACWQRSAMTLSAPSTVQCMPDCFSRWPLAACTGLHGAGADEHAERPEVLVAHPVRVVPEVAELGVQVVGFDAGEG
jgi:hypothetical protein